MRDRRESAPKTVLGEAWGLDVPLGPPHHGISRLTWQVDTIGWLARESAARSNETEAEIRLLTALALRSSFAVPVPIPTSHGAYSLHRAGYTWTLCHHIAGGRLADKPSSYQRLVTILATVHRELRGLGPDHGVIPESLLSRAREMINKPNGGLPPASQEATAWLRSRIGTLSTLPAQSIHGDFCIPNVLVRDEEPSWFGILDWELSTHDAPVFDLAQLAFGMIAFSRIQPSPDQLAQLTRWYAAAGGEYYTNEQLTTALVARQLAQIHWLQKRIAQGEAGLIESVRFLDDRLTHVLRWLEQQP